MVVARGFSSHLILTLLRVQCYTATGSAVRQLGSASGAQVSQDDIRRNIGQRRQTQRRPLLGEAKVETETTVHSEVKLRDEFDFVTCSPSSGTPFHTHVTRISRHKYCPGRSYTSTCTGRPSVCTHRMVLMLILASADGLYVVLAMYWDES